MIERIATGTTDVLGEGPVWDRAGGVLWWVDIGSAGLRRLDPVAGHVDTWDLAEVAGSLTPTDAGPLLMAVRSGFATFEPGAEVLTLLAEPEPDRPGNRFNDGKTDRRGRFWAGSMEASAQGRSGALYRFDLDGSVTRVRDGLGIPNSLAWSPDGTTMYFAESLDRTIWAFDYDPDTGTPTNQRIFTTAAGPGVPDGSTVDADGYLWNAEYDGWRVVRYAPDGSVDRIVEMPIASPTCCAFGGADLDTLYITSSSAGERGTSPDQPDAGGLFATRPGVRGLPETPFGGRFRT